MRLYVECISCHQRVYLARVVERRRDLPYELSIRCPHCGIEDYYDREEVEAESSGGAAIGGAALGGLVGLLGGPLGVILGGLAGGALGANSDAEEERRVRRFYGG